jgi:hypothetical protein
MQVQARYRIKSEHTKGTYVDSQKYCRSKEVTTTIVETPIVVTIINTIVITLIVALVPAFIVYILIMVFDSFFQENASQQTTTRTCVWETA